MRRWLPLIVAGLGACHGGGGDTEDVKPLVRVTTALVERTSVPETATLVGRLVPRPGSVAVLSAPTDAVVRSLPGQVGTVVKAGDLLVELDAPELEANAVALGATAEAAERDAARQAELLQEGIASRRSVEEKQATATSARAAADAAARLLGRTRVTSPISGRVQRVLVNAGERVSSGTPLVEVIRPGLVDLMAQVPAPLLARLKPGQPAAVTALGVSAQFPARVHAVAPAVDSSTNSGTAILRLSPNPPMLPGAAVTASVTLGELVGALVVPDSALVLVGDSLSVFVVQPDSTVRRVGVEVRGRAGGRTAVAGALQPGARVVSTGAYGLGEGMKVEPTP